MRWALLIPTKWEQKTKPGEAVVFKAPKALGDGPRVRTQVGLTPKLMLLPQPHISVLRPFYGKEN